MQKEGQVDSICKSRNGKLATCAAACFMSALLVGIWKDQYLAEKKELDEKMARVGRKVRGMWESEERKKQLRSIQVSILYFTSLFCLAYTLAMDNVMMPDFENECSRPKIPAHNIFA